jgi:hypothetical protein
MEALWIALALILVVAIVLIVVQRRRRAGGVIAGTKPRSRPHGE